MDKNLDELRIRLAANNYSQEITDEVIRKIEPFAGYGFNKSHSAAYALIAYQTAYLKCHYPVEFFAASMTVFGDKEDKLVHYIKDAEKNGIAVLPPDVNESNESFTVIDNQTIHYGLNTVKSLPEKAIAPIIENRPFSSIPDMVQKTGNSLNKTACEVLCYCGALDGIKGNLNRQEARDRLLTIRNLKFDMESVMSSKQLFDKERHYLGLYMTGHPLDGIAETTDWHKARKEQMTVKNSCILEAVKRIQTKKGDQMAFVTLSFMDATIEGVLFPNQYSKEIAFHKNDKLLHIGDMIQEGMILKISGCFSDNHRGEESFIVNHIDVPVKVNSDFEEFIKEMQEDIGVEQVKEAPVQVPSFDMDGFFN